MNHVQIELTNRCNFQCEFCEIKNHRVKDEMPIEQVYSILDQLVEADLPGGKVFMVSFNGVGEPLLYHDIGKAIKYAKERFPFVGFITNGYFLTKEIADEMLDLDIDYITVSINAVDGDIYEKFQGYGLKEPEQVMCRVLSNIEYLLTQKERLKKHMEFRIPFLMTKDSEKHLKQFLHHWRQSGHEISIQLTKLLTFGKLENAKYTRCERLTEDFMIFSNGDITICACDQKREGIIGNIRTHSISEVLNGDKYMGIVKANSELDLKNMPSLCLNCEKMMDEGFLRNHSMFYKVIYVNSWKKNLKWKVYSVGVQWFTELKKHRVTFAFFRKMKNYMVRKEIRGKVSG